jgi:hypothetical protein
LPDQHQDDHIEQRAHGARRAYRWAIAIVAVCAGVLTVAALVRDEGDDGQAAGRGIVAAAAATPLDIAPHTGTETPTLAAAVETSQPLPTPTATAQPDPTAAATPIPTVSFIAATPTAAGGSATATPVVSTPTPAAGLSPAAQALAGSIESQFGVRLLRDGQDWGADDQQQLRNIGAVGDALTGLPESVLAAVNVRRPLTFLSNHTGMTEAGWEPYGAREANFYSNEDALATGRAAANQMVLQPGSNSQTIAHEVMHAYQMRDIGPGEYAMALLTPEMKSFMQATAWTQIGSDDDVRAAISTGWAGINTLFEYDGRALIYANEFGDSMTLFTPNPLEAYAEAGGLYYGHSESVTLPEWAEYWDWFRANLG